MPCRWAKRWRLRWNAILMWCWCANWARPATLKRVYTIDLPRPRVMAEVRYHPNFIELSKRIWADLREEVVIH